MADWLEIRDFPILNIWRPFHGQFSRLNDLTLTCLCKNIPYYGPLMHIASFSISDPRWPTGGKYGISLYFYLVWVLSNPCLKILVPSQCIVVSYVVLPPVCTCMYVCMLYVCMCVCFLYVCLNYIKTYTQRKHNKLIPTRQTAKATIKYQAPMYVCIFMLVCIFTYVYMYACACVCMNVSRIQVQPSCMCTCTYV